MPYLLNTPDDQRRCSRRSASARSTICLRRVPPELRLQRPLDVPPALSEMELTAST